MPIDHTRPVRSIGRQADRTGTIIKRSPLDDADPFEQRQQLEADRAGRPYLVYRDNLRHPHLVTLAQARLVVGRSTDADVVLDWDRSVSRRHATIEYSPEGWYIVDDGQSLNGTLVNEERIHGRRFLRDRDLVQVGETGLAFRDPTVG